MPLSKLPSMNEGSASEHEHEDQDGLRARSEQVIGELVQALLDSQVLESALAAAFGAREKALEAQHAAMAALNVPSAGDVERLERRLRSLSQRLEEVEDQVDEVLRDLGEIRRRLAPKDGAERRKTSKG
jgi:predicted RNase H-like nuclease (RuvC/YqgF family)